MEITLRVIGQADASQIEALEARLKSLGPALQAALSPETFQKVQTALGQVADRTGQAGAAADKAKGGFLNLGSGFDRAKAGVEALGQAIQNGIVPGLGVVLKLAGLVAGATVGLGATFLALGAKASEAYATIANRTGAVGADLEALNSSVRSVAAGTAYGMNEVASVMGDLTARTGQTGTALEALTRQQLQLAKVTGTDVRQNVALTTRMFGDWGIATTEQASKLDLLFRASQQTGQGVDSLSRLVVQFGAPLRNFGFSFEEATAMLGRFQRDGVNTELVMGSLRIASGKFADAGIDLREGLSGAIQTIKEAGSSSEATAIAMDIFGARAGADMADTIRGGKFAVDDLVQSISSGKGTIEDAAAEAAGMSGALKTLGGAAAVAISPVTDAFFDLATKTVRQAVPAVQALASHIGDRLAPLAADAKARLGPLIEQIGPVLSAAVERSKPFIDGLIAGAALLFRLFLDVGVPALQTIGGWLGNLAGPVLGAAGSALLTLGGIVRDWVLPVLLLVADAVGWVAGRLGEALGPAVESAKGALSGLGGFLGGVFDRGKEAAGGYAQYLVGLFTGDLPAAAEGASTVLKSVFGEGTTARISQWATDLQAKTGEMVAGVTGKWSELKGGVTSVAGDLWASLTGAWDAGTSDIGSRTSQMRATVLEMWGNIRIGISGLVNQLLTWLSQTWAAWASWIQQTMSRIATMFSTAWTWIGTTVSGIVSGLANWLSTTLGRWGAWAAGWLNKAGQAFSRAWNWIGETVSRIAGALLNWLVGVFQRGGAFIAGIWDRLSDATAGAWNAIIDIFRRAATPIINGVVGLFTGIANVAKNGMLAVGGFIERILRGAVGYIKKFITLLGPLAGAAAGLIDRLDGSIDSFIDSVGGKFDGLIDGIKSGVSGIASAFGGAIAGARERVATLFAGRPGDLTEGEQLARQGEEGPGVAFDAGGFDAGAFGGGGGGGPGGGSGSAPPMQVGDSGTDRMGDFYIDDSGKKVYTSGAGKARQDAAAAAKAAKGSTAKAAPVKPTSDTEASAAETMARIAARVSEAWQKGMEALRAISDADLPGRDKWEPKVGEVTTFIEVSIGKFDVLAQGLLDKVGQTEEGADLLDTAKGRAITAVTQLSGGMIETLSKTAGFLQSLRTARWPTPEQVDRAFDMISGMLVRIRDRSIDLASVFQAGEADESGDNKQVKLLGGVGSALGVWADLFAKVGAAGAALGASTKQLAAAPAAMAVAEGLLMQIANAGARLVAGLKRAVPDAEDQQAELAVSARVAETAAGYVDLVAQLGSAADAIRRIPRIPDVAPQVEAFFSSIGLVFWRMQQGLAKSVPSREGQVETLEMSRAVAATAIEIIRPLAAIADVARGLRQVLHVPEGVVAAVERFVNEVGLVIWRLQQGLARGTPDRADQAEALSLSQLVAQTIGASAAAVGGVVAAMTALASVPDVPENALTKVQSVMLGVAMVLHSLVVGPGYNLLADPEASATSLAVVQTQVKTISDGVALVQQVAGLGKVLGESEPVDMAAVDRALANASAVERAVARFAADWSAALDRDGVFVEDVIEQTKSWGTQVKEALGIIDAAAKLAIAEVKAVDASAVARALANAEEVEFEVRLWASAWVERITASGAKIADVLQQTKDWAAQVKEALGIVTAAAGFAVLEVKPVDTNRVHAALTNAELVEEIIRSWAASWTTRIRDAGRKIAEVTAETRDYGTALKGAMDVVTAAGAFALGEVKQVDATAIGLALSNAEFAMSYVELWMRDRIKWLAGRQSTLEVWGKEIAAYASAAKGAVDLVTSAAKLIADGARPVSAADLATVMANVEAALSTVHQAAQRWVALLRTENRELETVAKEAETYGKQAGGAVDLLGKAHDLFAKLVDRPVNVNLAGQVVSLRQNLVTTVSELAAAFDEIQKDGDRLKKAGDLAAILSPAADAVAKALDALSLEKLLKNPLVDTKLRSGFMSQVAARRLEALGKQISEGIRRTVAALVDGLKGVVVPEGIASGLERILTLYERMVIVLERVQAVTTPDPAKIRAVADALHAMQAAMAAAGGGASGVGGGTGLGAPPPGGPIGGPPPSKGGAQPVPMPANLQLHLAPIINLDGQTIGRAVEQIIVQRGIQITLAPAGG